MRNFPLCRRQDSHNRNHFSLKLIYSMTTKIINAASSLSLVKGCGGEKTWHGLVFLLFCRYQQVKIFHVLKKYHFSAVFTFFSRLYAGQLLQHKYSSFFRYIGFFYSCRSGSNFYNNKVIIFFSEKIMTMIVGRYSVFSSNIVTLS